MAIVVIGGQASGVGKTGVVCGLIAAMPERRWTAIKITQCSHRGSKKPCDCGLDGGVFAVREERDCTGRTDSSRYLAAGAARSLWVRTLPGHLGKVAPRIEEEIAHGGNTVIESNSVLEFLRPDVYALVVSPRIADFKATARRYLDRADAILEVDPLAGHEVDASGWPVELQERLSSVPQFSVDARRFVSPGFIAFVRTRLNAAL